MNMEDKFLYATGDETLFSHDNFVWAGSDMVRCLTCNHLFHERQKESHSETCGQFDDEDDV